MNVQQRKFLVEKLQTKTKERIEKLRKTKLDYPSASNYLFKAAMNGTLKLRDNEEILSVLKRMALEAKEGTNWLSDERMGYYKESHVRLRIEELMVLPEDLLEERRRVAEHNRTIEQEIETLTNQLDNLELRVHLASESVLKSFVNEVDDMGNLTLFDMALKGSTPEQIKLLEKQTNK